MNQTTKKEIFKRFMEGESVQTLIKYYFVQRPRYTRETIDQQRWQVENAIREGMNAKT